MENLLNNLEEIINNQFFIQGTLSNLKKGIEKTYKKVSIKPFDSKQGILYQITYVFDKKVTHQNVNGEELLTEIKNLLESTFRNAMFYTKNVDIHVMTSKKGSMKVLNKKPTKQLKILESHNRKKKYIIEEGEDCDFLIHLGVMSSNGKVHAKKFDKFKQINKFLEIVENSLEHLDNQKTINIIDFGCGKAYLTFALYYYLVKRKNYKVNIIGLDLKEDVIDYCNHVARELNYVGLCFLKGDIKDYDEAKDVDMVITLHACDTATDAALSKAVIWGAKVILSVPCCQHELFDQIQNDTLEPMLKHGLIKERLSSLVTDSMRTCILEIKGYEVVVIEFIDMEHTPKNLMIKAVFNDKKSEKALNEYELFKSFWNINPYLERELMKEELNTNRLN
ncbi:class I SAM-dependent methyltransferase [Vallitalea okinawensis]|uniref:class I SAM-dependent methyltransferase n=1 Tax=Vallitalea okinawensis TaxID=2078660 RepID=UPI000CFE2AD7|nr:SAM-dependent methyltransferase [Vallitalea okinawensis]